MVFIFCNFLFSKEFTWGDSVKIGISKEKVDMLLRNYTNENYPNEVKEFHERLLQIKKEKLKKYENTIYLSNGLMWQDVIENKQLRLNALEAKRYCKSLTHATKKDWRLPDYLELLQLINYFRYDPAVEDDIKNIVSDKYWTVSNVVGDYSAGWYVDFKYGQTGVMLRTNKLYVRCVRDLSEEEDEF